MIIASHTGHRLPPRTTDKIEAPATMPFEDL